MGYWMVVYSRSDEVMELETIEGFFEDEEVTIELCCGECGAKWEQIELAHTDGPALALIEVHRAQPESVKDEITHVLETEPRCNAEWVAGFLAGVKTIYAFQILSGVDEEDGWEHVRGLLHELVVGFDGILYADLEGFSNQEGYHITWEFSDGASGEWWMALFDPPTQTWRRFRMELSNPAHREAFRAGRVPEGAGGDRDR